MFYPPTIKAGTDDFSKLLIEGNIFVDKSLMIKEFLEDSGDVLLITARAVGEKVLT